MKLTRWRPTATYMMETEAHVYALAIAASVLLSFYPFLTVMLSFCSKVLHWPAAVQAIYVALDDYFPGDLGSFVRRNAPRSSVELGSMFLLLLTANGVFEPLEVALNRAWGVPKNRPYWRNQLVALGMIFACGSLALLSLMFSALNRKWVGDWAGGLPDAVWVNLLIFKVAALPLSMLALFLVYWLLPNRKISPRNAAVTAIVIGVVLEALKYLNLLAWRFMQAKISAEYGVFQHSATIVLWSFMASMIVLAGAEWSARRAQTEGSLPISGAGLENRPLNL
ncbi:MAG TPA: YihY/virulence factor BrkB family protein [Bryobacteraceae bacterium]|nr:YihY/virulence factor BrkB family protein [Bryobacteraceae bacterium]